MNQMTAADFFKQNRYIYLTGVLPKEECAELTKHMFDLHEQGKLVKDDQCPLSDAVYGDKIFDTLLQRLAGPLSDQLGVKLLPTYTYARIYRPGEILKRHTDRPSCEISATMTLGYDPNSAIWPIHIGKDEKDIAGASYQIDVGDLIMYHGEELPHWRKEYKGEWQVQVFFHYVDANGPYKDLKYDGRPNLGQTAEHRNVNENPQNPPIVNHAIHGGLMLPFKVDDICPGFTSFNSKTFNELKFTPEECEKIINVSRKQYSEFARVGGGNINDFRPEVRMVDQYTVNFTEENAWIFQKLGAAISTANFHFYQYDLMGITHSLQLLHYKPASEENGNINGHYDWHTDVGPGTSASRKLSMSLMLSPEDSYVGGDLIVNDHGVIVKGCREQGSINMFPSYALHTVEPVTRGERWVLVIWVHGSQRFK